MVSPTCKFERHAIVIGGGMAGLLAARVLSDYFTNVSLVERDAYPTEAAPRPGVPQGRHVHLLLARGQQVIEEFFPGIRQELLDLGAVGGDLVADYAIRYPNGWLPRVPSPLAVYACTRPLLEGQIRQRLLGVTNVQVIEKHEVISLHVKSGTVAGVKMRQRDGKASLDESALQDLAADLVVDASGRDSHVLRWLEELGYELPRETLLNPFLGYASRFYKPTADPQRTWQSLLISSDAPRVLRGGVIQQVEGGRWLVVLAGVGKDYPPTDPDSFLEFARGMIDPTIYEILKDAEPLSPIYGYRQAVNRWRYFEQLKRQPEGLLVVGDAVCSFDPVYGQGMTVAALGARTLANCLDRQPRGDLTSLARTFQRQLARTNRDAWQLSVGADYRILPPEEQNHNWVERMLDLYTGRIAALMPTSPFLSVAFSEVLHLLKPSTSLFRPAVAWRVFTKKAGKG